MKFTTPFGDGWAYDGQQGCIFEKTREKEGASVEGNNAH